MGISRKKKIAAAVIASLVGIGATTVTSVIVAYDAIFGRYERPDYALYPGQYCIERIPDLERSEMWIKSGKNKLKTYFYDVKNKKGIIVFAHGIHAGADEYLPIIKYMTENGYAVIAYNSTGTYESEGENTVGMCQTLVDIDNVIAYLNSSKEYSSYPLFTMGHSWGGYAASSVLALKDCVNACALIAPMRNGSTLMLEKGEQYVGKLARIATPIFHEYQKFLFGDYIKYDAIAGINNRDIPVLVAHGVDDKIITFDGQSVNARKDEITNPNVTYYIGTGVHGTHDNIWHSEAAANYQAKVKSELNLLEMQKGEKLTDEEKIEYYKTVDHALYSEVNEELMRMIVDMFDKTLSH